MHSPVPSDPFTSAIDVLVKSHSLIIARKKYDTSSPVSIQRENFTFDCIYSMHSVAFFSPFPLETLNELSTFLLFSPEFTEFDGRCCMI